MVGFSKEYWKKNYADPEEMDGIFNAQKHALYLKNFFAIDCVEIDSLVDLGFGLGHNLKEIYDAFKPTMALGIEPSHFAFEEASKLLQPWPIVLKEIDLLSWSQSTLKGKKTFDLGICTGVIHYISDEDLKIIIPILAKRFRYLYFSVPTNKELDRQIEELNFFDAYALRRSKSKYLKMLRDHFTIVSARILESKNFFNEKTSELSDLLFRF